MRPPEEILRDLSAFTPVAGDWLPLDDLLTQLWQNPIRQEHLSALLSLFERFPEEDGAGVLWSIVHGLEATELDYESTLRVSLERQESEMARILLDRLERSR